MQVGGDDLISIVVDGPRPAQRLATQLRAGGSWLDVVAGMDSVVVRFDIATMNRGVAESEIRAVLADPDSTVAEALPIVEIPIAYGGEHGPDLPDVCRRLKLSEAALIAIHTAREYEVDMLGFTPGFAYIGGLDERLHVSRLSRPRVHVHAGAVGIAGGQTGIYALPGPGGWPLIGSTEFELFDDTADSPFVLSPGTPVRFFDASTR